MKDKVVYSIIVPLYNEELVIDESYKRLKEVMLKMIEKRRTNCEETKFD